MDILQDNAEAGSSGRNRFGVLNAVASSNDDGIYKGIYLVMPSVKCHKKVVNKYNCTQTDKNAAFHLRM